MKFTLKKKETSEKAGVQASKKRKITKKQLRIISVTLIAIIVAGSFFAYKSIFSGKENSKGEITALAQMGSVSSVIEGSGTLEALQQYDITSLIKGEVIEDFFDEGDIVNEGDILYHMDDEDGHEAIDNARSSVTKAQRTYNNATKDINNLTVKSKTQGVVTAVNIQKGENVGANSKVAEVVDSTNMILEIQFLSDYARNMSANSSKATVTLSKNGTVLNGTVSKISTGSVLSSVGAKVTNVEISVPNPGAIKEGDYATAEVNGLSCSSEGVFKNALKTAIYTEVSGKVENVSIMVGDHISYGQSVAVLSNDAITDLDEKRENLTEAQDRYNDALEGLEDYTVKAPITGTIIQKNIKAGEKMDNNTSSVMAIIADLSSLVFQMSVDELDISKLSVGMDVNVTVDAIENVSFGAKVTNISIVGTSNNGVTSYPVKITLNQKEEQTGFAYENYDKLIPGMNVSASVIIESVDNVIVVPVSAVRRGNIVIVSQDSKSEGIDFSTQGITPKNAGENASKEEKMPFDNPNGKDKSSSSDINTQKGKQDVEAGKSSNNGFSPDNKSGSNERIKKMLETMEVPKGYKAIIVETGLSDETYIEIKQGLAVGDKVLLPDTTQSTNQNPFADMMPGGMGGGMPGGMTGNMGTNRTGSMGTNHTGSMGTNRTGGMR